LWSGLAKLLSEAGIPTEKISRSGYAGPDLLLSDTFTVEVKAHREAFKTLEG
jgi:hypothetical protein